jgi:hypothetical protein
MYEELDGDFGALLLTRSHQRPQSVSRVVSSPCAIMIKTTFLGAAVTAKVGVVYSFCMMISRAEQRNLKVSPSLGD